MCIVARNETKTSNVCSQLEKKYQVKTKVVVCDFANEHTIDSLRKNVVKLVTGLDLAMVFLNAGTLIPGAFEECSDE